MDWKDTYLRCYYYEDLAFTGFRDEGGAEDVENGVLLVGPEAREI